MPGHFLQNKPKNDDISMVISVKEDGRVTKEKTTELAVVLSVSNGKMISFKIGDKYLVANRDVDPLTGNHQLVLGE